MLALREARECEYSWKSPWMGSLVHGVMADEHRIPAPETARLKGVWRYSGEILNCARAKPSGRLCRQGSVGTLGEVVHRHALSDFLALAGELRLGLDRAVVAFEVLGADVLVGVVELFHEA